VCPDRADGRRLQDRGGASRWRQRARGRTGRDRALRSSGRGSADRRAWRRVWSPGRVRAGSGGSGEVGPGRAG
jgi:hypothetical protein